MQDVKLDRREFLQSATLVATAAGAAAATAGALAADASPAAQPSAAHGGEIMTRRWTEQRWLLDNTIRAVGVDWDQPRSVSYNAPCGPEANADFAAIRSRVQKYADIAPAFEATAKRREAKAKEAEKDDQPVSARQNYFMAAIHYAAAQWA